MLKSMTGYGIGRAKIASGTVIVEIKTLNYRYLEIIARLPETIQGFEKKIKNLVCAKIKRGRVNMSLVFENNKREDIEIKINKDAARKYYFALKKLKKEFKLEGDITLKQILNFPDILEYKNKRCDLAKYWSKIKIATERALSNLVKLRKREGKFIYNDLLKRSFIIEKLLLEIKRRVPIVLRDSKRRFLNRIQKFQIKAINNERIEMDFASFAQNCDISEETTRISAHVKNFKEALKTDEEVGKKLDFIAQELSREANTIAAKSQDFKISNNVIEIKAEIEKIREQVQNVE